jgi:hypothetical protein
MIGDMESDEAGPSDYLRVQYAPDDDETGKLSVRASAKGYSGVGAAWFDTLRLQAFANDLATYPIPAGQPITISGGLGASLNGTLPAQELLVMSVGPVGIKGQVGVRVHLSTERWQDTRPESVMDVRLELLTTYERLRQFSEHLRLVLDKKLDEAELDGEQMI